MKVTDSNSKANGKFSPAEEVLALASAEGIPDPEPAGSKPSESGVTSYPHDGGRFEVSSAGVFWCKGDGAKKRICDELRVEAQTRDAHDRNWGLLLTWWDGDGNRHSEQMSMTALHGDSADAAKLLASGGLRIAPGQTAKLREYLLVCKPEARARSVEKVGWHGPAYVTPGGTIGDTAGERIEFQAASSVNTDRARRGTAEGWLRSVAALAIKNSRVVLGICAAFAGPLLDIAGVESGGLHFMGHSSGGKTTVLKASASVYGSPNSYVLQWRATTNGLEGMAAAHNDGLLILDELGQADPKEAGAAAYMLANNSAKTRMTKAVAVRPSLTWRCVFLSSGEESLTTLVESAGKRAKAGQELRLATVPADAGAGYGAFECLHGHESGSAFSVALGRAAEEQFGMVGDAFLRRLVRERQENPEGLRAIIRQAVDDFAKEHTPEGASGQAMRLARRFGLLSAAGELATTWGFTGWEEGEADRGCGTCYRAWLERAGSGSYEDRQLLEQVRGFLEQHGASRFQKTTEPNALTINRAGWWRGEENGPRWYLVPPEMFKKEVVKGHDPTRATKVLQAHGLLISGKDGKSSQSLHVPASGQKSTRVYVLVLPEEKA